MKITNPEIFKAYDIRGIVGKSLNVDITRQIGRAIGTEALESGNKKIVVGRDGRLSGPLIASALSGGICETGCSVIDLGMVPTPLTYFANNKFMTGSAVSVTGSHNPPDYNGLKIVINSHTLSGERIQSLKKRVQNEDFSSGSGTIEKHDIVNLYLEEITRNIKIARPMRVVTDCGNGVAGLIAPRLLRSIGCQVTELYSDINGNFPNHHPDPSVPDNLNDLVSKVSSTKADIGIAFDGDGDRLGVVTGAGEIVWPDRQMILFARDILLTNPGAKIIFDVKCSRLLPRIITDAGGEAIMWKTGHSFIKEKIKDTNAALGGEMSGHIFFNDRWYGFDDAIYSAARLCELLSRFSGTPAEVFAAIPDTFNTPEIRIEMNEGEHHLFISELIKDTDFSGGTICNIDGVRVDYEDGFGLARASNTTPTVILRFEADTKDALNRIKSVFHEKIQSIRPDLKIIF